MGGLGEDKILFLSSHLGSLGWATLAQPLDSPFSPLSKSGKPNRNARPGGDKEEKRKV